MARILVVDDDLSNAEAIQLILEDQNHEVISVHNSDLVRAAVLCFIPDLIVMDILLNNADGRILCDIIKKDQKTMGIPILLITAMMESQSLAVDCLADMLMYKPFDYSNLLKHVDNLVA